MKRSLLFSIALLASATTVHADNQQHWEQYRTLAKDIQSTITSASIKDLSEKSAQLTRLSTKLIPEFIAKQPICKAYLTAALSAAEKMMTLSLADIEKDYHADGKLPPIKSAACYHAKDLLVHPATMAVIANTKKDNTATRKQIALELDEVLEHFAQVKKAAGV